MSIKSYSRTERVGDQLQREIAILVSTELDDPRARGVTMRTKLRFTN